MTAISDLPDDLLKEILCRVPMTSLQAIRSTCKLWNPCKLWNTLLKDHISGPAKEIMFITMYDFKVCLMSLNLHDHNPFIKQIGELKIDKILKVFHCSGLLLCLDDKNRLRVWNPYTGHQTSWIQTSWIQPRSTIWNRITSWFRPRSSIYNRYFYGMGYDSNNNHKILKVSYYWFTHIDCEIYDFKSRSWRIFNNTWLMDFNIYSDGVSLKGDSYFTARGRMREASDIWSLIICFDYTRETFRIISLPQYPVKIDYKALSLVSEEKLALLSWNRDRMEIWITNKIELNAVSWSHFLKVDFTPLSRFFYAPQSFFVDEKKKVAVICYGWRPFMVGEGGHFREVEELRKSKYGSPPMCTTYVPSLMQIQ